MSYVTKWNYNVAKNLISHSSTNISLWIHCAYTYATRIDIYNGAASALSREESRLWCSAMTFQCYEENLTGVNKTACAFRQKLFRSKASRQQMFIKFWNLPAANRFNFIGMFSEAEFLLFETTTFSWWTGEHNYLEMDLNKRRGVIMSRHDHLAIKQSPHRKIIRRWQAKAKLKLFNLCQISIKHQQREDSGSLVY